MKIEHIIFGIILVLSNLTLHSQDPLDPGWLWAESGGSSASFSGSSNADYSYERIVDVTVDGDNNYYYLAEVGGFNFTLGDMEFETYNDQADERDLLIFSTDSAGAFRWKKLIGGGGDNRATSLGVDNEGGVYVSGTVFNYPLFSSSPTLVHFDTDSIMPQATLEPSAANKRIFIIKYDIDGNFQWLRQPQGDETPVSFSGGMLKMVVEPDGTTHSLIALIEGTYFDGALNVPPMDTIGNVLPSQSVIVKYDSAGGLEGFTLIDMKPLRGWYNYQLAYDPSLERYYIADQIRYYNDTISINGYGLESGSSGFYLAALDNQGEVVWFHETNNVSGLLGNKSIQLDTGGDIYFTGQLSTVLGPDSFAGYTFETPEGEPSLYSPFLFKLDSDGNLLWGTNAQSYSSFSGQSIVVDDSNIYLGLGMLNNTWDGIDIIAPTGQGLVPDIQIIRFDAQTGVAQEVIHNNAITPTRDAIMAMAMDNNGDLIVGGYFGSSLFAGTDLQLNDNGPDSDFFIAKYHPDNSTGLRENGKGNKNLVAYPNPTSGILTIQNSLPFSNNGLSLQNYTLYDLQGRAVQQGRLVANQIDLAETENGVYVLRVEERNGDVQNLKVVKN